MADVPSESAAPKKEEAVGSSAAPVAASPTVSKDPTVAAAPVSKDTETVDDVPDPDEDDLDDLDDMLDDFSAVKIDAPKKVDPSPPSQAPTASSVATNGPPEAEEKDDVFSDDEFAKQLQAGMADLLGDMSSNPEMQAQFETIFKELGAAAATAAPASGAEATASSSTAPSQPGAASSSTGGSFQDNIRRTMEKMQASGESATAAATADSEGGDDFMAELMKQMQASGGEGGEEEFSKMLLGMMEQLTNKEILYEPMKELNEKFPDWLEKNKGATPAADLQRYEEQQQLVKQIVAKFEEPTYADSNAADREFIVDKMQKMQAAGSPPPDLVGDMPSAQDALGMGLPDEEGCNPQ